LSVETFSPVRRRSDPHPQCVQRGSCCGGPVPRRAALRRNARVCRWRARAPHGNDERHEPVIGASAMKKMLFVPVAWLAFAHSALAQGAPDPEGSSPLIAALQWIEGTLLGNLATTAAVIAVAM